MTSTEKLSDSYIKLLKKCRELEMRLHKTEMRLREAEDELASQYFGHTHDNDSFEDTLEVMDD